MSTKIFLPYVPKIWPYLLPISNAIGGAVAPAHGGYIAALCRKRGQAFQLVSADGESIGSGGETRTPDLGVMKARQSPERAPLQTKL